MTADRVIFVTGATGRQGGAAARALLERGYRVRGLTRDPGKPAAEALRAEGAEIVEGDLCDPSSVRPHLNGVDGVFAALNYWEAGYDGEVRQGRGLIDAATEAGVSHFVYSSVASADRNTGIAHFESKWEIEQYLRVSGLAYTVLRPVAFMDDWEEERASVAGGVLSLPLDPMVSFQQVAVADVGTFAAMALDRPDRWTGRSVDLAGDDLPMLHVADAFARVTGHPVRYAQMSWKDCRAQLGEDLTTMFRFYNDVGTAVAIPALRRAHPGLKTLERYLRDRGWEKASNNAAAEGGEA